MNALNKNCDLRKTVMIFNGCQKNLCSIVSDFSKNLWIHINDNPKFYLRDINKKCCRNDIVMRCPSLDIESIKDGIAILSEPLKLLIEGKMYQIDHIDLSDLKIYKEYKCSCEKLRKRILYCQDDQFKYFT